MRDGARLVATAALLPYSAGNAWISMVLVTADFRRRGIATKLVDACLERGDKARPHDLAGRDTGRRHRLRSARLHADAAIAAAAAEEAARRRGRTARYRPATSTPWPHAMRGAMGFDRSTLLSEFSARPGSRIVSDDRAMALVRNGRTARHIGPLLADRADQALALVDAIVRSETGPWLIDAVHSQEEFLDGLVASGWNIERPFQRMRFGRPTAARATAVRRRRTGIWIGSAVMHHSEIKADVRQA